jgi:hypothetical protein
MAATLFKDITYSVQGLVEDIAGDEIALPRHPATLRPADNQGPGSLT